MLEIWFETLVMLAGPRLALSGFQFLPVRNSKTLTVKSRTCQKLAKTVSRDTNRMEEETYV